MNAVGLVLVVPCCDGGGVTEAVDAPGRLLPRGEELALAVWAGLLWVLAMAALASVPPAVRFAVLYQQRTNEGIGWAGVGVLLVASGVLLVVATWCSVRAHGTQARAPQLVRAVRRLTWGAYAALSLGAVVLNAWSPTCFRTCAPFPQ